MDVTLVTCFFDTSKYRDDDSGSKKVYWNSILYEVDVPIVVFGDADYVEYVKGLRGSMKTKYVVLGLEELELWSYYDQIEKNRQKSWPSRDGRCPTSVHIICCSKILMVRDVINENPFNTSKFCFVDCNALGKCRATKKDLLDKLPRITDKFHVMVIGCNNRNASYKELYQQYRYCISGGIFSCNKDNGLYIAERFLKEFKNTTDAGYGHGEEMIWIKLLDGCFDRLAISYGDYSEFVINFLEPAQNHKYILSHCIIPYSNMNYRRELYHSCQLLLEQDLSKDPSLHLYTLYYMYLACYYLGKNNGVITTLTQMKKLCMSNDAYMKEFKVNESFFKDNVAFVSHLFGGKNPLEMHSSYTLGIGIPCYKPHLPKLIRLLDSIERQTVKPNKVVISTSQTEPVDLKDMSMHYSFPYSIVLHNESKNQSQNRNIVSKLLDTDYVSFIDADDIMHHQRCELLMKAIDGGAKVIVHSLRSYDDSLQEIVYDTDNASNIRYDCLQVNSHGYLECDNCQGFHNGHITVHKDIFEKIQYNETMTIGEDTDFSTRSINLRTKHAYIPLALSDYDFVSGKMTIGALCGGLGNQLFIVAKTFYEAFRVRSDPRFTLDYDGRGQGNHPSHYMKSLFQDLKFTSSKDTHLYSEKQWSYYDARIDIDNAYRSKPHVTLKGYWQSEKHFPGMKESLRKLLRCTVELKKSYDECLICVRRGDYLKYPDIHNPCGMDYYRKAITKMGKKKYYVTSDDMNYCKDNFTSDLGEFVFVDLNELDTFYFGLTFKHYIISNSSFHWWITYLSEDPQTILVPDQWINIPNHETIYRSDMTIVPRLMGV